MRCKKCRSLNISDYGMKLKDGDGYVKPVKCLDCGYVFTVKVERKQVKVHRICTSLPKAIMQIDEGEIVGRYKSVTEASLITGVNKSSISRAANRRLKSAGGYEWRWDDEMDN